MRKTVACIGFLVALLLALGVPCHAGLVAHWPMDEGSGDEVEDVVGGGGVGTFVGNPSWVTGKGGRAVECSAGNYISVPGNADLEPTSVTATMWVYFNDVAPPRQDFFSKNDDYALSLHEWADDGTIYPVIHMPTDNWVVAPGTVQVEAGVWYHIALVYDENSTDLVTYIDGVEDARTQAPDGIGYRPGPLTLGDYGGRPLRGIMDEVKVWNEALPQAEVQADMEAGSTAVSSHGKLAALWGQLKSPE